MHLAAAHHWLKGNKNSCLGSFGIPFEAPFC